MTHKPKREERKPYQWDDKVKAAAKVVADIMEANQETKGWAMKVREDWLTHLRTMKSENLSTWILNWWIDTMSQTLHSALEAQKREWRKKIEGMGELYEFPPGDYHMIRAFKVKDNSNLAYNGKAVKDDILNLLK